MDEIELSRKIAAEVLEWTPGNGSTWYENGKSTGFKIAKGPMDGADRGFFRPDQYYNFLILAINKLKQRFGKRIRYSFKLRGSRSFTARYTIDPGRKSTVIEVSDNIEGQNILYTNHIHSYCLYLTWHYLVTGQSKHEF